MHNPENLFSKKEGRGGYDVIQHGVPPNGFHGRVMVAEKASADRHYEVDGNTREQHLGIIIMQTQNGNRNTSKKTTTTKQ